MTCIVGLINNKKVYLGGDSAGVSGRSISYRKDSKVFKNNGFVMGFTSSFRMGQLLRYKFIPPKYNTNDDLFEYMVCEFVEKVRTVLKEGGYNIKDKDQDAGGTFIVGYNGRIFQIQSDYQVSEEEQEYTSVGCGVDLALGSLFSTENFDMGPKDRLALALDSAQKFSAGVCSPYHFVETENL